MKKFFFLSSVALTLILSTGFHAQAQTGADYFKGKWNVMVMGLPDGDTRMFIILDKNDSTLTGSVQDSTGVEISKFSKVELKDNQATVYFNARGFDVSMTMDKKDDEHVTGSMMGMFDATGERVKIAK